MERELWKLLKSLGLSMRFEGTCIKPLGCSFDKDGYPRKIKDGKGGRLNRYIFSELGRIGLVPHVGSDKIKALPFFDKFGMESN